jgi:O-antigen biosynthesis protein
MFPTTSLIICSRNRPGLLSDTVKSIRSGNSLPTELVIIDQSDLRNDALASTTGPPGCEIRYLWTHSVGLGRARNAGIAAARYDVIVFIDDDMRVTANWFENLISAVVSCGDRAVVTGQVLPAEPDIEGGFAPSVKEDPNPTVFEGRVERDVLFTGNMATWRTVMENVGPFDDEFGTGSRFPSSEDNDYGFRLLEAGYRIHYVPQACVYHRCWRPERDYLPLCWNYGLGQGAFYAKYSSLRDQFMLRRMCKHVAWLTIRLPWRVFRHWRRASGDAVFVAGILTGAIQWIVTRRRSTTQEVCRTLE